MKSLSKKVIGPLATVLVVLTVIFFLVRPDRIIGAAALGLFLLLLWGAVELIHRRKSGRS